MPSRNFDLVICNSSKIPKAPGECENTVNDGNSQRPKVYK